jgi:hypothetical protein
MALEHKAALQYLHIAGLENSLAEAADMLLEFQPVQQHLPVEALEWRPDNKAGQGLMRRWFVEYQPVELA